MKKRGAEAVFVSPGKLIEFSFKHSFIAVKLFLWIVEVFAPFYLVTFCLTSPDFSKYLLTLILLIHRASMIWIIGEYAERIDNAAELLESFLEGFQDENSQVHIFIKSV